MVWILVPFPIYVSESKNVVVSGSGAFSAQSPCTGALTGEIEESVLPIGHVKIKQQGVVWEAEQEPSTGSTSACSFILDFPPSKSLSNIFHLFAK